LHISSLTASSFRRLSCCHVLSFWSTVLQKVDSFHVVSPTSSGRPKVGRTGKWEKGRIFSVQIFITRILGKGDTIGRHTYLGVHIFGWCAPTRILGGTCNSDFIVMVSRVLLHCTCCSCISYMNIMVICYLLWKLN
jgi:hypothetical protein